MACDDEQRRVQEARSRLTSISIRCEQLDQGDPGYVSCMSERQRAQAQLAQAEYALRACFEAQYAIRALTTEGFVTFLRVHELETGWGGGESNFLDAEVIFKLDTEPTKSFGFQLRDDDNLPVREGMLALLQTALVNDIRVKIDYDERKINPERNSFVMRVALLKPRQLPRPAEVFEG